MPTLIVSSSYTTDSQRLRQTAREHGWETLRLDGLRLPDWFDPPDQQIALFFTAPHAFEVAAQLSRTLLGCNPDWTIQLPYEFLLREIRQTTLADAFTLPGDSFIKHSVNKSFPAAIYNSTSLAHATAGVPQTALVHVCEPVEWSIEYRCFIVDGEIAAISPYKRHGQIIENHTSLLGATPTEMEAARHFAESVLRSPAVESPPAFVLDVGMIDGRGWAVVEFNECWASGIYACDPLRVLYTLLRACLPSNSLTNSQRRWDFERHYIEACS